MQVIIWQDLLKCRSALKSRVQNFYGGQANIGHNIHFTFGVQEQVQSKCIEKRFLYFIFIFMDKDMQYVAEICSKQPFIALEWR